MSTLHDIVLYVYRGIHCYQILSISSIHGDTGVDQYREAERKELERRNAREKTLEHALWRRPCADSYTMSCLWARNTSSTPVRS